MPLRPSSSQSEQPGATLADEHAGVASASPGHRWLSLRAQRPTLDSPADGLFRTGRWRRPAPDTIHIGDPPLALPVVDDGGFATIDRANTHSVGPPAMGSPKVRKPHALHIRLQLRWAPSRRAGAGPLGGKAASSAASATVGAAGPPASTKTSPTVATAAATPPNASRGIHRKRSRRRPVTSASTEARRAGGTDSLAGARVAARERRWRSSSSWSGGEDATHPSTAARRSGGSVPSASAHSSAICSSVSGVPMSPITSYHQIGFCCRRPADPLTSAPVDAGVPGLADGQPRIKAARASRAPGDAMSTKSLHLGISSVFGAWTKTPPTTNPIPRSSACARPESADWRR